MALEFKIHESSDGDDIYENTLDYAKAKLVVEHMTEKKVKWVKTFQKEDSDNAFCLWIFEDRSYVCTPCGPSVEAGTSPKGLTYGYNDDMDIFVGFVPGELEDTKEEA